MNVIGTEMMAAYFLLSAVRTKDGYVYILKLKCMSTYPIKKCI